MVYQTRDLPACSAVPKPTAPPRAPIQWTIPYINNCKKSNAIIVKYDFTANWRNIVLSAGVTTTCISRNMQLWSDIDAVSY
jgi:hypothetical protein